MRHGISSGQLVCTNYGQQFYSVFRVEQSALDEALEHYIGKLAEWQAHRHLIAEAQSEAIASLRETLEHIGDHVAGLIALRTYEALTDDAQVAPQVLLAALETERIAGQADHGEAFPAEVAL